MRKPLRKQGVPVAAALAALRHRSGLSLAELANLMGHKKPSSIQRYFSEADFRGEFLKMETAKKFASAMVGTGNPQITEDEVMALTDPSVRAMFRGRPIPVISFVQAGAWAEATDPYPRGHGFAEMAVDSEIGPRAFALQIAGTSMLDRFQEGDRVAIDPDVSPMPGDCVVGKEDSSDEVTFKQYRPRGSDARGRLIIELRPLNEVWPPIVLDARNPGRILGTMVEHHSYRRSR